MPRKPNLDFEEREREKGKAIKAAERSKSKVRKADPATAAHEAGVVVAAESGDDGSTRCDR